MSTLNRFNFMLNKGLSMCGKLGVVILLSVLGFACSSQGEKPTNLLVQAEKKLSVAKSHNAEEYAPLAYNEANELIEESRSDMEEGDFYSAERHLNLSIAKSDFAIAKSKADSTEKTANEISQDLMNLQRESMK